MDGLVGRLGGTAGGTLGGAWGSVLCCRLCSCTVARVCLVGGVGLHGGAPVVAAKMSASFRMESIVGAPNREKGAASAGFARASARCLDASVPALVEDMDDMALLWGKNWTVLVMRSPPVSGI